VENGGRPNAAHEANNDGPQPPNVLVSNRTCSGYTTCTKSTSMVWHSTRAGDSTLVVNYNDDYGSGFTGTSYSTDNGATFSQVLPPPFASGHGTNCGDQLLVYNQKLGLWFGGDLVTGCRGLGSDSGVLLTANPGLFPAARTMAMTTIVPQSGSITIRSAPSMAVCTFPSITWMWMAERFSLPIPSPATAGALQHN
jgi:hypothetical protein